MLKKPGVGFIRVLLHQIEMLNCLEQLKLTAEEFKEASKLDQAIGQAKRAVLK